MFACKQCGGVGASYVEEWYQVTDHVMKHHMALDQTQFYYCKLCMFRCTTLDQLDRHVTSYKRHVTKAEYQDDASRYLEWNPIAKPIKEGTDLRPLTEEEQQWVRPKESLVSTSTPRQSNLRNWSPLSFLLQFWLHFLHQMVLT